MANATCPRCKAVLTLPEYAVGRPMKCPKCQTRFTAPGSRVAPEPFPTSVPPSLPSPLNELASQVDQPVPLGGHATAPQFRPTRPDPHLGAPNYGEVKFIGTVCVILGAICCILGILIFAFCLLGGMVGGSDTGYGSASRARGVVFGSLGGGLVGAIFGGIFILAGVIQIGMGELFHCIRDLARNSFHLQRL